MKAKVGARAIYWGHHITLKEMIGHSELMWTVIAHEAYLEFVVKEVVFSELFLELAT